jgi:thioredoxin reductase (NADPH)
LITTKELAALPIFSDLDEAALVYLAGAVEDIRLLPGEYVSREGEERALFVVVEGHAEITKLIGDTERVLAQRPPGGLIGEVPMTLSTPLPASCRATMPSRILKLNVKVYYTLAAMAPGFTPKVAESAKAGFETLTSIGAESPAAVMTVIGPRMDPAVHEVENFLNRNGIPFDSVPSAESNRASAGARYPIVESKSGKRLIAPSMGEVAVAAGLRVAPSASSYDLVIIGGGPAGLTAAVNGAAEGLRTIVLERVAPGGQAGTSTRIENYTGFPFGVSGDDLAGRALRQAGRLGAEIVVTRCVESLSAPTHTVTLDGGDTLKARAAIIASGVEWRRITIDSIDRFTGRGVYYGAARSDSALAHGANVFIIGAGNSAGQAAIFFSRHARAVTLIVRGESLGASMSTYLIEQIETNPNITVETKSEVVELYGDDELREIDVADRRASTTSRRAAEVVFVMIGADASTAWLPPEIARDDHGFIVTGSDVVAAGAWKGTRAPFALETSAPGIFAAGDVRAGSVKRVAAGVGEGGTAVALIHQYLALAE